MGIQETLLPLAPGLLRFYRTRLTLSLRDILAGLPEKGTLLDVGCGTGNVVWEVGRRRPELRILGIDLEPGLIRLAERFHSLPNVCYTCTDLGRVEGSFDCVSFVDVFHHVPDREKTSLLSEARKRLGPEGYIFVKDVTASSEDPAFWMDRYLSGCRKLWFSCLETWEGVLPEGLEVRESYRGRRFPFAHYYLKLVPIPLL